VREYSGVKPVDVYRTPRTRRVGRAATAPLFFRPVDFAEFAARRHVVRPAGRDRRTDGIDGTRSTMDAKKIDLVIAVIEDGLHDRARSWHVPFGWAEARTGVDRFRLLVFAVAGVAFLLILGHGAAVSSNVIGFAYPAYATLALMDRAHRARQPADDGPEADRWYAYWLTFVVTLIAENYCGPVVGLIPFYRLLKTLFLVWCSAPIKKNGAAAIHSNVILHHFGTGRRRRA